MKITLAYPYDKHKADDTVDLDDDVARGLLADGLARPAAADAADEPVFANPPQDRLISDVVDGPQAADPDEMNKAELIDECEARGLPTDGLKADLLARVVADDASKASTEPEPATTIEKENR